MVNALDRWLQVWHAADIHKASQTINQSFTHCRHSQTLLPVKTNPHFHCHAFFYSFLHLLPSGLYNLNPLHHFTQSLPSELFSQCLCLWDVITPTVFQEALAAQIKLFLDIYSLSLPVFFPSQTSHIGPDFLLLFYSPLTNLNPPWVLCIFPWFYFCLVQLHMSNHYEFITINLT